MMRKLLSLLLVAAFLCSCAQETTKVKVSFHYSEDFPLMVLPVTIQGVSGNMLFDTGGANGVAIDTLYAEKIEPFENVTQSGYLYIADGYSVDHPDLVNCYAGHLKVQIGSTVFDEPLFHVGDYKKLLYSADFDGSIGLLNSDSVNVWEVNYEENYISIVPADSFVVDKDALVLPLYREDGKVLTSLPVQIRTKQGRTVTVKEKFLIDTGSIADITFLYDTSEAEELNKDKDAAYWLYNRHFWDATFTVCDKVSLDAARVYVYDRPARVAYRRILGLNFLKRFNVFFDLKNDKLYLSPISKFKRITQGKLPWMTYDCSVKDGKQIIDYIADYEGNEAKKAGLRVGDEIVSINGMGDVAHFTDEQWKQLQNVEERHYVIKRNGKLINLSFHRSNKDMIED